MPLSLCLSVYILSPLHPLNNTDSCGTVQLALLCKARKRKHHHFSVPANMKTAWYVSFSLLLKFWLCGSVPALTFEVLVVVSLVLDFNFFHWVSVNTSLIIKVRCLLVCSTSISQPTRHLWTEVYFQEAWNIMEIFFPRGTNTLTIADLLLGGHNPVCLVESQPPQHPRVILECPFHSWKCLT